MKKFFMIAAMAVATLSANAQEDLHHWTITPHFGLGYSNFSDMKDSYDDLSNGFGSSIGADFMYQPTDKFGVSAGVDFRYSQSHEITSGAVLDKAQIKLSTVEIPVLAHYNFSNHFGVFAGVKFNLVEEFKVGIWNGHIEADVTDDTKSSLSIPVGFSYTFNKPWVLSFYYDIPTGEYYSGTNNKGQSLKSKESNIFVTIGYKFNI